MCVCLCVSILDKAFVAVGHMGVFGHMEWKPLYMCMVTKSYVKYIYIYLFIYLYIICIYSMLSEVFKQKIFMAMHGGASAKSTCFWSNSSHIAFLDLGPIPKVSWQEVVAHTCFWRFILAHVFLCCR